MDVSKPPTPDRMSLKGAPLQEAEWLGVVGVVVGSSTLGNRGCFYHFSC